LDVTKKDFKMRFESITRYDLQLSIIIPVKDEAQNVVALAKEISNVLCTRSTSWQCIWIDDGSTDTTLDELAKINRKDPCHQFISLTRNYGQSAALALGFSSARGQILVTMDGDGQNDPKNIPAMINRLKKEGADMVNGWRIKRKDTFSRKMASYLANSFRNRLTRDHIKDVGCSLRVFRHHCIENIPIFKGMHRFLPTLVRMRGFSKIIEMPVDHRSRKFGETKYGINNRLWVGIADTFAIRWMQSRMTLPEVKSSSLLQEGGKNL